VNEKNKVYPPTQKNTPACWNACLKTWASLECCRIRKVPGDFREHCAAIPWYPCRGLHGQDSTPLVREYQQETGEGTKDIYPWQWNSSHSTPIANPNRCAGAPKARKGAKTYRNWQQR